MKWFKGITVGVLMINFSCDAPSDCMVMNVFIKILGNSVFCNTDMVIIDVGRHKIFCYLPILGLLQQLMMTVLAA